MARLFYPHFIGDYDRDTAHLTFIQHGAYRLLLDRYYADGEPLPGDIKDLQRLVRASTREERSALAFVLAEFFVLHEGSYRHKRCEKELERMGRVSKERSASGAKGAAVAREKRVAIAGANAQANAPRRRGGDDAIAPANAGAIAGANAGNLHPDLPSAATSTEVSGSLKAGAQPQAPSIQTSSSEPYDPDREFAENPPGSASAPQVSREDGQPYLLALLHKPLRPGP